MAAPPGLPSPTTIFIVRLPRGPPEPRSASATLGWLRAQPESAAFPQRKQIVYIFQGGARAFEQARAALAAVDDAWGWSAAIRFSPPARELRYGWPHPRLSLKEAGSGVLAVQDTGSAIVDRSRRPTSLRKLHAAVRLAARHSCEFIRIAAHCARKCGGGEEHGVPASADGSPRRGTNDGEGHTPLTPNRRAGGVPLPMKRCGSLRTENCQSQASRAGVAEAPAVQAPAVNGTSASYRREPPPAEPSTRGC